MQQNQKRKEWVDALRALAIVLVVYGHRVPEWNGYFVFSSPIKIPLFFAITGYVMKGGDSIDIKVFFQKLFRTLVIPWLVLSIVPYLISIPIKGISYFEEHFLNILSGKEYWYMPCCIFAEIIWFFILKSIKKTWQIVIIAYLFFALGVFLSRYDNLSILMINRALAVQIYLLIGWVYRKYESKILNYNKKIYLISLGICVYLGLGILSRAMYPGEKINIHHTEYYNHVLCQSMIWIGVIILFVGAGHYVPKFPKIWTMIGQNTLVIYLYHYWIVKIAIKIFNRVNMPINRVTNIFLTAFVCITCLLISISINRILPELMGKSRKISKT